MIDILKLESFFYLHIHLQNIQVQKSEFHILTQHICYCILLYTSAAEGRASNMSDRQVQCGIT